MIRNKRYRKRASPPQKLIRYSTVSIRPNTVNSAEYRKSRYRHRTGTDQRYHRASSWHYPRRKRTRAKEAASLSPCKLGNGALHGGANSKDNHGIAIQQTETIVPSVEIDAFLITELERRMHQSSVFRRRQNADSGRQ